MGDSWCLEGSVGEGELLIVHLKRFPFTVGRAPECDLTVSAQGISRHHSEIRLDEQGRLVLKDINSTNGTFVNRHRISVPTLLADGDILHFGMTEFRLHATGAGQAERLARDMTDLTIIRNIAEPEVELPEHFSLQERVFNEMLDMQRIRMLYQPIVSLQNNRLFALEVLGRGNDPLLPDSPDNLFRIAAILGKEVILSRTFREAGVRAWRGVVEGPILFVNTHPHEMYTDELYRTLADLRQDVPAVRLVLEVHEKVVTDIGKMKVMANRLKSMGIHLAYDDFGAGQARLNELSEITPDYLKFDLTLVRNLNQDDRKRSMVRSLVQMSHDLGIVTLAEGAETQEEAECCRNLGFDLLQGFAVGRPQPIESFLHQPNA